MLKALTRKTIIQSLKEEPSPSLMKTFGIFGLLNFPLLYLIGASLLDEKPIAFSLRLGGFIFCLLLALIDYWPEVLKRFKNFYWFLTITYCLPFFATYMFIENQGSIAWQVKITVAMFWLILITNWLQSLLILCTGITFGIIAFILSSGAINYTPEVFGHFFNYAWTIVIASIFAHRKEINQQAKLQSLQSLQSMAGAIAHEMRTPLFSLEGKIRILRKKLPILMKGYQAAQKEHLTIQNLDAEELNYLQNLPEELQKTTQGSLKIIDILLTNLNPKLSKDNFHKCSIVSLIDESLKEYPLTSLDKKLINFDKGEDFEVLGNPFLLKHAFFNLLKNALYYVKLDKKGEIYIWLEKTNSHCILYFKDTGKGIPSRMIPSIFDSFFSKTNHGTGIGLSFCKKVIKDMGGDIACESIEGEYAKFILTFPII